MQNAADNGPNSNSDIEQTSSTGKNSATLNQLNNLAATSNGGFTGAQQQGSSSGGEAGRFNQTSTGVSTINGGQVERQNLTTNPVPGSTVSQTQLDPMAYDPNQGTNTADTYNLSQSSTQNNNTPGGFQEGDQFAQCFTSGNCTVSENINQNGHSTSNSCGPTLSCDIGQSQTNSSEGTSSSTCEGSANIEIASESEIPPCVFLFPAPPPPPSIDD
jgi:hypothetical protein